MTKTFYIQVNEQNKITDVIEYPYDGYIETELSIPLPPQILGGAYELLNGSAVYHKEWDTPMEEYSGRLSDIEDTITEIMFGGENV